MPVSGIIRTNLNLVEGREADKTAFPREDPGCRSTCSGFGNSCRNHIEALAGDNSAHSSLLCAAALILMPDQDDYLRFRVNGRSE